MSGVLIGVGAAVGAVTFGGNSIYGMNKQNRNTLAAFKKQMKYLQINYNYNQAALDRQERSMYDNALGELFTLSLNAYQNNSQIEAAIAETGLEGRSQEKIEQTVRGQTARQETATKEAYMMDVWNVRSQKDALYIQTKASVEQARDNLNNNLIYGSKAFQQFLGSTLQGASIGASVAGFAGSAAEALSTGTKPAVDAISSAAPTVAKDATTGQMTVLPKGGSAVKGSTLALGATAGGTIGTVMKQAASTTAQSTASQAGSFMNRMIANYQQYKPYVDFVQQWADYYNQNLTPKKQRGGYFY